VSAVTRTGLSGPRSDTCYWSHQDLAGQPQSSVTAQPDLPGTGPQNGWAASPAAAQHWKVDSSSSSNGGQEAATAGAKEAARAELRE